VSVGHPRCKTVSFFGASSGCHPLIGGWVSDSDAIYSMEQLLRTVVRFLSLPKGKGLIVPFQLTNLKSVPSLLSSPSHSVRFFALSNTCILQEP
jgi:hypothetical protein